MSFSFEFLAAVVFLLPGLITVLLIFNKDDLRIRRTLPASGSLLMIATIPFSALLIHTLFACLFYIIGLIYRETGCCFSLSYNPNIYETLLTADEQWRPVKSQMFTLPLTFLFIGISPFFFRPLLKRLTKLIDPSSPTEDEDAETPKTRDDWLVSLLRASQPEHRTLIAFVLSKITHDKATLGYSGELEKVSLDNDGEIKSVTLYNCVPFTLTVDAQGVERKQEEKDTPIPFITFQANEIQNLAFEIQEYESADNGEVKDDSAEPTEADEADTPQGVEIDDG